MIKEDYISPEVAELLKEKGMDKSCFKHYVQKNNNDGTSEAVTVCTLQMAMKWLREVHDLIITIDYDNDVDCLEYERWGFTWYRNPHYEVNLNTYATYEEACEAAIKYSLENLI